MDIPCVLDDDPSVTRQHSLLDASGKFVCNHVFVQFRAVIAGSLADVVANVPIEVSLPIHKHEYKSVPSGVSPVAAPDVDRLAEASAIAELFVQADEREHEIEEASRLAAQMAGGVSEQAAIDELDDQFSFLDVDDTASTVSDHDLRSSTPKLPLSPERAAKDGGDDDDDESTSSSNEERDALFAQVDIGSRTRDVAPPLDPFCLCPNRGCAGMLWGHVRVTVRAVANLPGKNFLNRKSDPYVKVEIVDWQRGAKSGIKLRTAPAFNCLAAAYDETAVFVGGTAWHNHFSIRVLNDGFADRGFGMRIIGWPVIAALKARTVESAKLDKLPPIPVCDLDRQPTIQALESEGCWFALRGDKRTMKKRGAVCVRVERVHFKDAFTGKADVPLSQKPALEAD